MDNRQVDMLKAALPYAAPAYRKPMQVYIQAKELSEYIRDERGSADVEACGFGNVGNVEGLMDELRSFCTREERDMIDTVLNIMKAQRLYRSYRGYVADNGHSSGGNEIMDFLMSGLSPEQKNMFAQMSTMMKSE